ncbi:uncharacterized protein LOC127749876 [Frankliniella occidentalis]|uniref:Uncharacterized protein LOC127749876 n=1 Tax=Frankliniella occidentalis TaxID=133901 RepID=A0A9C6WRQ6_FRAOC|nr:uncharacterized protein LOC127749876 [Frankliniella occidentalis]
MAEHLFEQRRQKPGESAAEWVADLRQLAIPCNFTDLDRRLRAQLVRGVADKDCQVKLLEAPALDVKKAVKIIQTHKRSQVECEALSKPGSTERAEAREPSVMYVQQSSSQNNNNSRGECFRCGRGHNPDTCWAKDVECRKCGAKGHLKRRCVSTWKKGGQGSSGGQGGAGKAPPAQGDARVNMLLTQPAGAKGAPGDAREPRGAKGTTGDALSRGAAGAAAATLGEYGP